MSTVRDAYWLLDQTDMSDVETQEIPVLHVHHRSRTVRCATLVAAASLSLATAACSGSADGSDSTEIDSAEEIEGVQSDLAGALREEGLSTFASAVDTVDVAELIDTPEFTLLAPSDEAFQAMTADELGDLLADPESLLAVLRNHVITERISADELAERSSVQTQAGADLTIASDGADGLTIDGVAVTATDIGIDDGVVHVVDQIFIP